MCYSYKGSLNGERDVLVSLLSKPVFQDDAVGVVMEHTRVVIEHVQRCCSDVEDKFQFRVS